MENEEREISKKEREDMMGNILDDYVNKKSRFLKIASDEEVVFIIRSYGTAENLQGEEVMAYKVELEDYGVKTLQSASVRLAKAIGILPKNGIDQKVRVKKTGEGFETKWTVELVNPVEPTKEDEI